MWMERVYRSGNVVEKSRFWVPANARPRTKKKASTISRKQDANDRDTVKRLARIINCNFTQGDIMLCLTYDDKSYKGILSNADPRQAASVDFKKFIRKLKTKYDGEFKYVAVTSDMDGDTYDDARMHHHVIIKKMDYDIIKECWPNGTIDYVPLKKMKDYSKIAAYFLRQVRKIPNAKKYYVSRNMEKPIISESIVEINLEIRVPNGAVVMERGIYKPECPQYVRYTLKKGKKSVPKIQGD